VSFQNSDSVEQGNEVKKSRHLPILDFYENLQIEYIQADLRHKIYPRLKDKAYWQRVKEGKKATIEKLSAKNNDLPSIFTDTEMLRAFEKRVYRDVSFPIFTYRDENHKMEQEYYDLKYYYNIASDVRIDLEGEVLIGKISKEYIPFNQQLSITVQGKENKYPLKYVTRIL
jgi:hypothetical protein